MNSTTTAPWHPGGRICSLVPLLLAAFCMIGDLHAATPEKAAETGIRGTILWGPVLPGPTREGQNTEAPLSASFLVFGSGHKVASFQSDDKGQFEVLLPAGEYTIVPDKSKPILYPGQQKKAVTVPEDDFAVVTLRFDTGMR